MNEISKIIIPGNTIPYDLRDDYARERIDNSHLFVVSPLMTGTIDIYTLLGRVVEPYEGLMLHILCTNNNNDSITPTFIRLAATESPIEIEYSNFIRRRPINGGIYSFVLHYIPEEETTPAHWNFYPIDDTLKSKGVEIIEYTTEADAAYAQVKKALSQNILPVVHYIDTNADNYEYWLPLYEYATDKTGYIFSASTAYTSSEDISLSYIRINLDSTTWTIDNCGTNTVNIPTMTQAKGLFYGTCQTSNATAAKTVTGVADWPDSLFAGQTILIKFQHGNNVKENLTLSINGSTAAPIVTYDGVNPAAIWAAGSILLFIYSGTDWRLVDGAAGTTPDWAQNDATMSDYIKNRPFFDISEVQPDPNQFVDIVSMSVNDLVKLNDYQNMIMVWKSIDNVLSNLGSPWFIFRFFSTRFNKEIDFSYELYTNRQDITMLDDTNFYTEFVASFGTDGQKKARIYFILDTTKLDTASAALFNSKGVYYKCVESMSSLQSCKIGMMYKTVTRLESRYLRDDVESAKYKVGKLEDANNPDNNYPSVKAVNLALDKKLTRLNTVISYDSENSKYVSSVDFASLLAAAQQPDKYIVTAIKSEQSDLTTSSTKEDLYLLTGIDNTDGFKALTFACSAVKKTSIGTIEKNEEKRICITDDPGNPVSFLSENVTSALKETGKGAIYRSSMTSDVDALGANSVNLATRSGSTGVSAFATGYGVYHPRYGWGYLANNASGDNSAAFGSNTTATQEAQFVCGKQNEADTEGRYQFIVGIGGKNGFAVTTNGEIVLPTPNASSTKYMKARFNSDGTITLSPVADDTASYTTECTTNRTTSITAESTDAQYPTAKAVYDALQDIDIPSALPNPYPLTFTGAVTGSYYGSAPMSVKIPSAVTDDHINSLIDAKLGVIENGSY